MTSSEDTLKDLIFSSASLTGISSELLFFLRALENSLNAYLRHPPLRRSLHEVDHDTHLKTLMHLTSV